MTKNTENGFCRELPEDAMRQNNDTSAGFSAFKEALAKAAQVRGGMYWHKGPRSAATDRIHVRCAAGRQLVARIGL
nr:hypothetical protein [uncultured Noviherbaspirillum sp.]